MTGVDRLCKNVASDNVSFRRNLPLKKGVLHEEETVRCEQIVAVLKEAEAGMPVAELIRRIGITEQTFYRWKKQYSGLDSDQARQLKQLQRGERSD